MKKAFVYLRISDDDQSKFSISGQWLIIEEYCKRNNITIAKQFTDDGYSAKDFNRPAWKELESLLKRNTVDFVIVWKYDRLIRNAAQGLAFVEHLESKLNTTLVSAMENYGIDPSDPYFFKIRADMFVDAEFERRRIADRTKMGLWSGKSQGRYLGKAPYGYQNVRIDSEGNITHTARKKHNPGSDMAHIIPEPVASGIVKDIFEDFLNGHNFATIQRKAEENGFDHGGKEAIKRILLNKVYAGLIDVPGYKTAAKKTIKAVHEPLISEDIYWKSFYKIQSELKPNGPKIMDLNLPLRGFVECELCSAPHTGTKCKGRNAYYYYYWCNTCRGKNYRATKIHEDISTVLKGLSLPEKLIEAYKVEVKKQLTEAMGDNNERISKENTELQAIVKKLKSIEEKYIDERIDQEMFQRWSVSLREELTKKKIVISELETKTSSTDLYDSYMYYLNDLNFVFQKASTPNKIDLLKAIFPGGLSLIPTGFRTKLLADVFVIKSNEVKGLLDIKTNGELSYFENPPLRVVRGNQLEPILKAIERIMKAA